jgi:quinol-cytochrome oxidoreductase complex cytochrome b subunit
MTAGFDPSVPRGRVDEWVETRLHTRSLLAALLHVRVPRTARTFYFGGITLFLFGVQVVTGTLLALYYKATPDGAYESVRFITSDVSFGWLIRSIHHWAANLMILFLVLHLLRIFVQAAYKFPRELTWLVGVGLLVVTMAFGFTGYLLPWDQKAFWATTVGTEIGGSMPFIGDQLLLLLRGGAEVGEATLTRFYGIHVLLLPLMLALLTVLHLTFVHQTGLADPTKPEPRPRRAEAAEDEDRTLPFFPNYILDEIIAWYALLAVLVIIATLLPVGLEEQADPLLTPEHIKPEWYFLGVYELLKHVPYLVGILVLPLGMLVLAAWPFIDRGPEIRPRKRLISLLLAATVVVGLIVLTIWGLVS